jgi:ComF family protein
MRVVDWLISILDRVVFPQTCVLCGSPAPGQMVPLCGRCLLDLPSLQRPICHHCGIPVPGEPSLEFGLCSACRTLEIAFDRARSWGPYSGSLRQVIWSYKFGGLKRLAVPLVKLLQKTYRHGFQDMPIDYVIPVPLHPRKRRLRGFDQTQLLARGLSRETGIPLLRGVNRVRDTSPQYGLSQSARRSNVAGAFEVRRDSGLRDRSVLVVDDVLTTGATVSEVGKCLRLQGGVAGIGVLTVARVPRLSLMGGG